MKTDFPKESTRTPFTGNQAVSDVQTVMLSLGYDNNEIESALANVMSTIEDASNTEEILRKALTNLSM
jgi:Holliday junction resolvasome RuvABC DNA-binding subunit